MQNFDTMAQFDFLDDQLIADNEREVHSFQNGSQLIINRHLQTETVQVVSKGGEIAVTIEMGKEGPIIRFTGARIQLNAKKKIELNSPVVELNADKQLKLQSGGDLHQTVAGDLHEEVKNDAFRTARIQHMTADLGNVNIKANDDVRLDGERVKLNCND